jgi:hypothetical protein
MDGWIKLHRVLTMHEIWTAEPFTRGQAWVDLLLLANHKPGHIRKRGIRVEVERGQVGWSEVALATRWKWSRGKVRRFLSELESKMEQQIVQQKNKVTTVISITNYNKYQSDGTTDDTTDGHQTVQQTDIKRYRNKNEKNEKNKKNKNILSDADASDDVDVSKPARKKPPYTQEFAAFWSAYPKKVGKDAAWRAWKNRNGTRPELSVMLSAIEQQRQTDQWQRDNGQYIPNPATWLNQGRWGDETAQAYDPYAAFVAEEVTQ